jgi:hypothetical protein
MRTFRIAWPAASAAMFALFIAATPAHAAPRTFVSGTGSDAGSCTRAAPCLTFNFAHNQTDPGGEINCVDAGDFGNLTISKSITIDCAGTVGGINPVAGAGGITVNSAGIVVRLRNLTLNGMGGGTVGVRFNTGAALFVENCVIANFNGGAVGDGIGIKFAPPAGVTAELYVTDTTITTNGRAADGGGIVVQPAGTGSARVAIERTRVENNTYGIFANGTGSTGVIALQVRDSVVAESKFHGISSFTAAAASTTAITVERSSSLLNGGNGILAQGAGAFVLLADSTVMSNVTGLNPASGGSIFSYQDNQLTGNVSDGAPTALLTVK